MRFYMQNLGYKTAKYTKKQQKYIKIKKNILKQGRICALIKP